MGGGRSHFVGWEDFVYHQIMCCNAPGNDGPRLRSPTLLLLILVTLSSSPSCWSSSYLVSILYFAEGQKEAVVKVFRFRSLGCEGVLVV